MKKFKVPKIESRPKKGTSKDILYVRSVPKAIKDKFNAIAKSKNMTQGELFIAIVSELE